jgi:hypothetical protein
MKSALWKGALALAFGAMQLLPCKATVNFQIYESGSLVTTAATVAPGGTLTLDVVAVSVAAEGGIAPIAANLDSFTYRIIFPNTSFTLQNNVFAAPFDNDIVALGGFNGSIPWAPPSVPIDLLAYPPTPLDADLYRTTATTTGVPVAGPNAVIETLTLEVPVAAGIYAISLNVLEAADSLGALHNGNGNGSDFIVTVTGPCSPDTAAPTITLAGANPLIIECQGLFTDPGATAVDDCPIPGTPVAVVPSGTVDPSIPGSYTITYTATDASGNTATATRTVNVVDTTAPVIALVGLNPLTVECPTPFVDPGATASDACAGSVPAIPSGPVDAGTPGS